MARIRSIHPGLWTDEAFVCASPMARLLFIGIWNECDDGGSFDWSPVKLKMRILPGDNADTAELLSELVANGCIKRYEIDSKSYGAVRNFCRFQRPKKPNSVHPQTDEIRKWCGNADATSDDSSEPVGNQFGTASEIAPQMEEGGGRMEEEEEDRSYSKTTVAGRAKCAPEPEYAFSGSVIRLSRADFDQWRGSFHAIPDLRAELVSLDGWLAGQAPDKQKRWFHVVGGSLNRKHQEILVTDQRRAREEGGNGPAIV